MGFPLGFSNLISKLASFASYFPSFTHLRQYSIHKYFTMGGVDRCYAMGYLG